MNRIAISAIATSALAAAALLAVALIASTPVYADDITMDPQPFASTRTRESVLAELRTPYAQGDPWSEHYDMFQAHTPANAAQSRRDYIADRNVVAAFGGEDSGSAYIKAHRLAPNTRAMGAPR